MTCFSVIMPVYNVNRFVSQAIESVLQQTFLDFELIIINDCSTDDSLSICQSFNDPRIKIITHEKNKGLAASRNTGIRNSLGRYLAFLDSDDMWHKDKLELHFKHLKANPQVGVSFSRSAFIDSCGEPTNCYQMPKLKNITPKNIFLRNPVGNGSAPVIRRAVFSDIMYFANCNGYFEPMYFDESFRRSEDIECWIRIALTTNWEFEGIPEPLTYYRLNEHGLSASLDAQYSSWRMVKEKVARFAPSFAFRYGNYAEAYQLRYLSRQAVRLKLGFNSIKLWFRAVKLDARILVDEPGRCLATLLAATMLTVLPTLFNSTEKAFMKIWGMFQLKTINE